VIVRTVLAAALIIFRCYGKQVRAHGLKVIYSKNYVIAS